MQVPVEERRMSILEETVVDEENEMFAFKRKKKRVRQVANGAENDNASITPNKKLKSGAKKTHNKVKELAIESYGFQGANDDKQALNKDESQVLCLALRTIMDAELETTKKTYCGSQRVIHSLMEVCFDSVFAEGKQFLSQANSELLQDVAIHPTNTVNNAKLEVLKCDLESLKNEQLKWQQMLAETKASTILRPTLVANGPKETKLNRYQSVYSRISQVPARVGVLENSVRQMVRALMVGESTKESTINSFHSSEFSKYPQILEPKAIIQALSHN